MLRYSSFAWALLACLVPTIAAEDALQAEMSSVQQVISTRDARLAACGAPVDVLLTLENATFHTGTLLAYPALPNSHQWEDTSIRLQRRGGQWMSTALSSVENLPAHPSVTRGGMPVTIGGVGGFEPFLRHHFRLHSLGLDGLKWQNDRPEGRVSISSSRFTAHDDMQGSPTFHHVHAVDITVPGWDLAGRYRARPYTQDYTVFFEDAQAGTLVRLKLINGFRSKKSGQEGAPAIDDAEERAGTIDLGFRLDAQGRLISGIGWMMNRSAHLVDPSALKVGPQGIQGELRVSYNSDPWLPLGCDVIYSLNCPAPLADGSLKGRYTIKDVRQGDANMSAGDGGAGGNARLGTMNGQGGDCEGTLIMGLIGRYSSQGPDGAPQGRAFLDRLPVQSLGDIAPAQDISKRFAESRVLIELLGNPELQLVQAQSRLAKDPQAICQDPKALAEGLSWMAQALKSNRENPSRPLEGVVTSPDPDFGPYASNLKPLALHGAASVLSKCKPQAPAAWGFIPQWRWCGPLISSENVSAQDYGVKFQAASRLPPLPPIQGWSLTNIPGWSAPITVSEAWFQPAEIINLLKERAQTKELPGRFAWYATALLEIENADTYWLALPAMGRSALWIDQRLIWRSDAYSEGTQYAVFPVKLSAGGHEIMLQAGQDGVQWNYGVTKGFSPWGINYLEHLRTGLAIAIAGEPRAKIQPGVLRNLASRPLPTTPPPIAWNLAEGKNVRWRRNVSATIAQPVLDGDRVYIAGNGTLSAHSLVDGKELWRRNAGQGPVAKPMLGHDLVITHAGDGTLSAFRRDGSLLWQQSSDLTWQLCSTGFFHNGNGNVVTQEPVLAGEIVVVLRQTSTQQNGANILITELAGVSASQGRILWRQRIEGQHGRRLMALELERGPIKRQFVLSDLGHLFDACTGERIHHRLQRLWGGDPSLPQIQGDTLVFASGGVSSFKARVRCWLDETGKFNSHLLWWAWNNSKFCGPEGAIHDGILYLPRCYGGHHMEGPNPISELLCYDLETGTMVSRLTPLLPHAVAPKAIDLVGGLLYSWDTGGDQFFCPEQSPKMAVISPGEKPLIIAENIGLIGHHRPLYGEGCIILSGEGQVVCIAADNPDGRMWQAKESARTILYTLGSKPIDPNERRHKPQTIERAPEGALRNEFVPGSLPLTMLTSRPFARARVDEAIKDFKLTEPSTVAIAGQSSLDDKKWTLLPRESLYEGVLNWTTFGNIWAFAPMRIADVWKCTESSTDSAVVLSTLLEVREPWTFRFNCSTGNVRAWISGCEIKNDDIVEMRPGSYPKLGIYPFHVLLQLGRIPPRFQGRRIAGEAAFVHTEGLDEKVAAWRQKVHLHRAILTRIGQETGQDSFLGEKFSP